MDDLDLPDNDDQVGSGLIDSLFTDQSRQRPKRVSSAGAKRPTVRFAEPSRDATPASVSAPPSSWATKSEPAATSFIDNLFSSTNAGESASNKPRSQQQSRRSVVTTDTNLEASTNTSASSLATSQYNADSEQLQREISNLRFERNELQQTINEMNKAKAALVENHEKKIRRMRNDHQEEIDQLRKEHAEELLKLRTSIDNDIDVVRNVKRQEDQLATVQSRLENVNYTLNNLRDTINSMGNYNESVNRIVDLADHQISQGMNTLHTEMDSWERRRQNLLVTLEQEIDRLAQKYNEEIVQGRKWVETERDRLRAEQQAFQEEQTVVLTQIGQKQAELEKYRTEFITKEHDLLVRVVNERAQLDEQSREFQRQRNADITRMREEAEHLERCLQQVEQSYNAIERTRKELEQKHHELDDLHAQLVQHETNYWRFNQGLS